MVSAVSQGGTRRGGLFSPSFRLPFRQLVLLPVIALAMIVGTIVNPAFLTADNLINILQQSSELSILVIAESLILIAGKFDLSLESIVGICPMVVAWLVSSNASQGGSGIGLDPVLGVVLLLLLGTFVGAFNGFLIVKLRLNAFITTLAMLILLRGTTVGITNGQTLYNLPPAFLYLGNTSWLGIPVSIWIAAILYAVFGFLLHFHRLGRALYAIGGNPEAARIVGIRVDPVIWGTFALGGFLAALAGLMLTGRIASVMASQGQNMIFYVFAAAVIGGISLDGGRGSLLGALTGVVLLGILQNVLTLSQIAAFWIDAAYGAIILLSLVITRLTASDSGRA